MESMEKFFVDKLDVRVLTTRDQMGEACAMEAGNKLRQLLAEKDIVNIIKRRLKNLTLFVLNILHLSLLKFLSLVHFLLKKCVILNLLMTLQK